jgi:hypothetical protein
MDADFSIELGPDAPALELPWRDHDGEIRFVNLRSPEPIEQQLERIPEVKDSPALRRFLMALNSERSVWQTVKCDLWHAACAAEENLYGAGCEQGSYIDLVLAQPSAARADLALHMKSARKLAAMLEENEGLAASAEIVVRRCYFHSDGNMDESEDGYCLSFFLTGYGSTPEEASSNWEQAMDFAAHCWTSLHPEEERTQDSELG